MIFKSFDKIANESKLSSNSIGGEFFKLFKILSMLLSYNSCDKSNLFKIKFIISAK